MMGVLTLVLIGLLSGIVTALSPCVLPVLPVVLVAANSGATDEDERARRLRPFIVIAGLLTSFAVFTLLGSAALSLLGLPQDLLRWVGLIILAAAGLGLIVPAFGDLIEKPFARIPMRKLDREGGGFVLGLGMGLVFVPCAGPVLAAITVLSATGHIDLRLVVLTLSFTAGVAIPLLAFALAGQRVGERIRGFRERASTVRKVSGAILMVTALALAFNVTDVVQRYVPGYVSALQDTIEGNNSAKNALDGLHGPSGTIAAATDPSIGPSRSFDDCSNDPAVLANCGLAPEFTGVTSWLNTPGNKPLTLAQLRGKVVLVDFWTYSCINCQRTLPSIEAWNKAYSDKGLVIVGVHTPEFPFERVVGNIQSNAQDLGVTYPIAVDNDYKTWNAYNQQYWPAHYLIDRNGIVRQVHYGEGEYSETENLIRQLLSQSATPVSLPGQTAGTDQSLTDGRTPETYVGAQRMTHNANDTIQTGRSANYSIPNDLRRDNFGLGGTWTVNAESATSGNDAELRFHYFASNAHLVLGGHGTLTVSVNGEPSKTLSIDGAPKLYTLTEGAPRDATMTLKFTPGIDAYAFTFG